MFSTERSFQSDLSPEEFINRLRPQVMITEAMDYKSKLSGAGVVIRTIFAPETDRPFFGSLNNDSFQLAMNHGKTDLSPFQPILHGQIRPEGRGTICELRFESHPEARVFFGLHALGGLFLWLTGALVASQKPEVAIGLFLVGVLFFVFPRWRAKSGFEHCVQLATDQLEVLELGLGPSA